MSNPWDGLEPADAYFLGWTDGRGARFGLDYERDDAWDALRDELATLRAALADGNASDGYHTHSELYDYRRVYNAALFNEWARTGRVRVVKSWRHSDGELAFGGGWFIVVATLPSGQVSNHYETEHWDQFRIQEVDLPPEYDGHTPAEALGRLEAYAA